MAKTEFKELLRVLAVLPLAVLPLTVPLFAVLPLLEVAAVFPGFTEVPKATRGFLESDEFPDTEIFAFEDLGRFAVTLGVGCFL